MCVCVLIARCAQKLPVCYGASAVAGHSGNAVIHAQGRLFELEGVPGALKIKEIKFIGAHK